MGKKNCLNSSLSAKRQKGGLFYRYFFVNVCENWREESEGNGVEWMVDKWKKLWSDFYSQP